MSTRVQTGNFRHRLTIEQPTYATSVTGEKTATWSALKTVWGSFAPESASEVLRADRLTEQSRFIVTTWHVTGLNNTMRIVKDSQVYRIVSVEDVDSMGAVHRIICVKDGA